MMLQKKNLMEDSFAFCLHWGSRCNISHIIVALKIITVFSMITAISWEKH